MHGTVAAVNEQCILTADNSISNMAQKLQNGPLALSYFVKPLIEVNKERYTVLEDVTDTMRGAWRIWRSLDQHDLFQTTNVKQLVALRLEAFPKEEEVNEESSPESQNRNFNSAVGFTDKYS